MSDLNRGQFLRGMYQLSCTVWGTSFVSIV